MVMLPMVNRNITVIVVAETAVIIQAAMATLSRDERRFCGRIRSEAACAALGAPSECRVTPLPDGLKKRRAVARAN